MRGGTVAYARKSKTNSDDTVEDEPVATPAEPAKPESKRAQTEPTQETVRDRATTQTDPQKPEAASPDVAWPDATPLPMKPVEPPAAAKPAEPPATRAHTETVAMPPQASIGRPPEMPPAPPPVVVQVPRIDVLTAEQPTRMPGPREIPPGNPEDPAAPPGPVPRGDSRSLRRTSEFALIYRIQTYVISRFGTIGTRGQWRVVEYPTSTAAAHAYAKECSRFVSEGFSDYRD